MTRARALAGVPLYRNALVLMGNFGLAAGLGFVFWTLAARLYPPAELGLGSATISAALFVTTVAQFGLPYGLVRFSPAAGPDRGAFTTTLIVVVTLAGALAGVVFIAGIDTWSPALTSVADRPVLAAAIIVLAGATAASTMLVYVAVGARDTRPALVGGLTHGVVKCAVIIVLATSLEQNGFDVVLSWLLGTLAAVVVQVILLRRLISPRVDLHLLRLGEFLRYCAGNYGGDLAWTAPGLLFPLIIVGLLGPEANAYFYVAWAISGLLAGIPTAVASSLLAEGSHSALESDAHLRRALWLTMLIVTPAAVVCWIAAPVLLNLFGEPYAEMGVNALRLLSIAAIPVSLNLLFIASARVDRAMRRIIAIAAVTGGGSLLLGVLLAGAIGVDGIALAYLIAQGAMSVYLVLEEFVLARRTRDAG